ncbi:hypothetical protein ABFV57_00900 [Pseudomonas neuropathica]|jgi:hypothetical protein|uniref:hypothetical protein n=1 Tax=Pseudomonas neuropathica TaxID=2730425 RepID=UPI0034D4CDCC
MIKLDPEINRTAIRAIKTMDRVQVNTSIIRVTKGSHVAVVTGGNRLREGHITEIDDYKFTMKRSNGTKIDILYKDVNGLYVDYVEPGIGNIDGKLSVLVWGHSEQVINIQDIVPTRLPPKPVGYHFASGPDGFITLQPNPQSHIPTVGYDAMEMTMDHVKLILDIGEKPDRYFADINGNVP